MRRGVNKSRIQQLESSARHFERVSDEYRDQVGHLSNDLRIVRQERDEYQRCYNAHNELLNQMEDKLEGLLEKNRQLEDYNQMMVESMVLKEEKIRDLERGLEEEIRMRQEAEREVMVMMRDRKEQTFVTNDGKPLTAEILVELETRSEKLGLLEQHSWLRSDEFLRS